MHKQKCPDHLGSQIRTAWDWSCKNAFRHLIIGYQLHNISVRGTIIATSHDRHIVMNHRGIGCLINSFPWWQQRIASIHSLFVRWVHQWNVEFHLNTPALQKMFLYISWKRKSITRLSQCQRINYMYEPGWNRHMNRLRHNNASPSNEAQQIPVHIMDDILYATDE